MSRCSILFAIAILGFSVASALPLYAQGVGGIPQYYGGTPLSPWLNISPKQGGALDNYHLFVQPNMQLNNTLQAQRMGIQGNAAAVNAVGDRIATQAEASNAAVAPTGQGAGFMNHYAYFGNSRGSGMMPSGATTTPGRGAGGNIGSAPGLNTPNNGGQAGFGGMGRAMGGGM